VTFYLVLFLESNLSWHMSIIFSVIIGIGGIMNTEAIIEQIDAEISRLQQAKVLLNSVGVVSTRRAAGRPKSVVAARIRSVSPAEPVKRVMSAEGKARIAEAQKARWAAQRKQAKKATKAAA
jgi:hypothetical protein